MYIIGENIHIISPHVKDALAERNGPFFTELARKQVAAGASALDLNIGPRKKDGPEVITWLLDQVCAGAPDVVYSLDTTNLAAIEAGLKKLPYGPGDHQFHLRRAGAAGQCAASGRGLWGQARCPHHGQRDDPGEG